MKKLYYCEDEGNFYFVKQTPKTIKIDWIPHFSGDEELDQRVRWENLIVRKNGGKHPLKQNSEKGILVYPYQAGQPFHLVPATIGHITCEMDDCRRWGVSAKYYEELGKLLTAEKEK